MIAPAEDPPTPETETDAEENQGISAGYTYLGQFIDHDLTFDPASSLCSGRTTRTALIDFRTPRFDLDNIYGGDRTTSPICTERTACTCSLAGRLTGNPNDADSRDLPRHASQETAANAARALIGDPRNDENVIVSQLQATMLRFHNRMVDANPGASLDEVQRMVRWHYQWVVLHDFLPTIVGQDMVHSVLPHLKSGEVDPARRPVLQFYKWRNEPFIPIGVLGRGLSVRPFHGAADLPPEHHHPAPGYFRSRGRQQVADRVS